MSNIEIIKKLRELTGAGVMDAKSALEEANGDIHRAQEILKQKGLTSAKKRADRSTQSGLVYAYIHRQNEIGVLIEVNCETSFVAHTDEFRELAHELALQIASMSPNDVDDLLKQTYIRDSKMTIQDLVNETIAKTGENIIIHRFTRYQLGT